VCCDKNEAVEPELDIPMISKNQDPASLEDFQDPASLEDFSAQAESNLLEAISSCFDSSSYSSAPAPTPAKAFSCTPETSFSSLGFGSQLVDGGANHHLSASQTGFISYEACDIRVEGLGHLRAVGRGTRIIAVLDREGNKTLLALHDSLHVPGLRKDLISESALLRHKAEVLKTTLGTGTPEFSIRFHDNTIVDLKVEHGLYWLPTVSDIDAVQTATTHAMETAIACTGAAATMEQWHDRMHVSDAVMQKTAKIVDGLKITTRVRKFCKSCATMKSTKQPRSRDRRDTPEENIVYTDIKTMETETFKGHKYFIVFSNARTKWPCIYLMKKKSEAPAMVAQYITDHKLLVKTLRVAPLLHSETASASNASGSDSYLGMGNWGALREPRMNPTGIDTLASDRGSVFTSKEMRAFANKNMITLQFSTPDCQWQNGVAERMIRTIVDLARTLLMRSGLGKQYWGYAALVATHYVQRIYSTATDLGVTPHQLQFNVVPSLAHIRVFGCRVYVHVNKDKGRKTLDKRAREGILLGYDMNNIGTYIVEMLDTKMIVRTRDCTFDESSTRLEDEVQSACPTDAPADERPKWRAPDPALVGRRIKKNFGLNKGTHQGTVVSLDEEHGWFKVKYDDNDSEEMTADELFAVLLPIDALDSKIGPAATKAAKREATALKIAAAAAQDEAKRLATAAKTSDRAARAAARADRTAASEKLAVAGHVSWGEIIVADLGADDLGAETDTSGSGGELGELSATASRGTATASGGTATASGGTARETTDEEIDLARSSLPARTRDATQSRRDSGWRRCTAARAAVLNETLRKHCKRGDKARAFVTSIQLFGEDPKTWAQAMKSKHAARWKDAFQTEMKNMKDNGVLTVIRRRDVPAGANICGSKMIYKIKMKNGALDKFKARWVAKGFTMRKGIDWTENYASVARMESARLLIALCAGNAMELTQIDFSAAFLNAELEHDVYIELPPGADKFDADGNKLVGQLNRSLYGLRQSSRNWQLLCTKWLIAYGFIQSKIDACVFTLDTDHGKIILSLYVDDILAAHTRSPSGEKMYRKFVTDLGDVENGGFKIEDLGRASTYLGVNVTYHADGSITIDQNDSIEEAAKEFGVDTESPPSSPMVEGLNLSKADSASTPEELEFMDSVNYRSIVGKLIWFSTMTRVDVTCCVSILGQFLSCPGPKMWYAARRALAYLYHTRHDGITYHSNGNNVIVACTDADWSADKDSRRSRTGFAVMLNGGAISWKSKLQTSVALSTTEAEYYSAGAVTTEVLFLRQLIEDFGFTQLRSTPVLEDNQGCIGLAKDGQHHSRAKHIDRRHHFIRDAIGSGLIQLVYCKTDMQPADIFTKALGVTKFEYFRNHLMGTSPIDHSELLSKWGC
jgi:hypothetical protein